MIASKLHFSVLTRCSFYKADAKLKADLSRQRTVKAIKFAKGTVVTRLTRTKRKRTKLQMTSTKVNS